MLPPPDLVLGLLALGGAGCVWYHSTRLRERALVAIGHTCDELRVQLLDQTVALRRIGLVRDADGQFALRRTFVFEFSAHGSDRCRGTLVSVGDQLESMRLEHPDGPIVIPRPR
ncbi:MAG: DUF3301 domain-containing protein [Gammaproteobacteria bacterium]|nr:DUF3301 domain-containing protein [Gammaproteobacteria bacterium]